MYPNIRWPEGKHFAFTIFDDPDSQDRAAMNAVYSFLRDIGVFTTKGVWPNPPHAVPSDLGETCGSPGYVARALELQHAGFEIGYHNATSHTSDRVHTIEGLNRFHEFFGHDPLTMSNHYFAREGIYFGDARLTGMHRVLIRALRRDTEYLGHVPGQDLFWGDLCKERLRYVRNFVFGDINTLKVCPWMPYNDPLRPYVNYWYCSAEGANLASAVKTLCESNQDRLEEESGACILYVHFGHQFAPGGVLDGRFRELMTRLSRKNGWFVPVRTLLDFLRQSRSDTAITRAQRNALERRWVLHKLRFGSA